MLAALALAGREVLVDDLVVVDQCACYAGPRCIDLRPDAAGALGLDGATAVVRSTERRRLPLPPARGSFQLRGFVHLASHGQLAVATIPPAEHFGLLVQHRRISVMGADIDKLLDIARNEKDVEVRKDAIFWLSRSKDPRATKLIEDLLNK